MYRTSKESHFYIDRTVGSYASTTLGRMMQGGLIIHIGWISMLLCPGRITIRSQEDPSLDAHLKKIYRHNPSLLKEKEALENIWSYHYQYPIELYHIDIKTLATLRLISNTQIRQLSAYADRYGPLASVYELQAVPTWDVNTIKLLLPFVQVSLPWHVRATALQPSQVMKLFISMDKTSKKEPKQSLGGNSKVLIRYQLQQPKVYTISFIASKEPYEPLYWHGQSMHMYGPLGYWTGYGMIENMGSLKKLILGAYQVGTGQGLILGTPFSMNKSQEVISIMKTAYQGIKPNASFQRKSGFRGLACTLQEGNYEILLFFSLQKLDSTIHTKRDQAAHITTLHNRGISYTSHKALSKKDTVQEKVAGTALIYKASSCPATLGAQALYSHYSVPIHFNKGLNHTLFFEGEKTMNTSLFGDWTWQNYHFFAEIAYTHNNSVAGIGGAMASLGKSLDSACIAYHYPPNFHSLHGNAFGRKGDHNRNKRGLYLSIQYKPIHALQLKTYIDLGQHLASQKSLHYAPAQQQEIMLSATYKPSHGQSFSLVLKGSQNPKNAKGSKVAAPLLRMERRGKLIFRAVYGLKQWHDGQTQFQLSSLQKPSETMAFGAGIKQLFHYKNEYLDLKWWIMLYHSPSYDTAIRFYTHNLRGGMSYPPHHAYYGCEAGLILRYRLKKNLRIGLRIILNGASLSKHKSRGGIKISLQLTYK